MAVGVSIVLFLFLFTGWKKEPYDGALGGD